MERDLHHAAVRVAPGVRSTTSGDDAGPSACGQTAGTAHEHSPDHVQVLLEHASFSLVTGTPTEHVHIAFPASDDAAVDAFHRSA